MQYLVIFILIVWAIGWVLVQIEKAISLTIDFIVANWEMHAVAMFFVIVIAVLYVTSEEEKKEERKRTEQKKRHRQQKKQAFPPKPYEPKPEKFTLQYYGAKKSMSKLEICKVLDEAYIKYINKQTSTIVKVQDEAQKHKDAIMELQTMNACRA